MAVLEMDQGKRDITPEHERDHCMRRETRALAALPQILNAGQSPWA
jgi:hypothetical protein